jgi:putative PIN family toxin of toxin-antitoxin system
MKIMIDSNVLVSAIYNPKSMPNRALHNVCENHTIVLCDHIIAECYDVLKRKFPHHIPVLDTLLTSLGYELVVAPRRPSKLIADPKDAPILNAAILSEVDIIISGDKHFLKLDLERPKPITVAQYLKMMDAEE